jgi:hypothetical protein
MMLATLLGLYELKRMRNEADEDNEDESRTVRYNIDTAIAALEATAALRTLGSGWIDAAAQARGAYLMALHAGKPPAASRVRATQRKVPQCLSMLGKCLPTAEGIKLLAGLAPIVEVGAGPGIFARALACRGIQVAATDANSGGGIGLAHPVQTHTDVTAAMSDAPQDATILVLWPSFKDGLWFRHAFENAGPSQAIAVASPEFEFALHGGVPHLIRMAGGPPEPGYADVEDLVGRIRRDFDQVAEVPVMAAGWPLEATSLRVWRKR